MLKKMFLLIAFVISSTFSGFIFAENDNEDNEEENGSAIDLLQVRDVVLKSTYMIKSDKSISLPVLIEAEILRDELLVVVENFEGILEVDIISFSGSQSLHKEFFAGGSGSYGMDISSLAAGNYKIELNLGSTTYIGKFSIEE
jgi:hypothetical protein